jgi:endonuclease/exonuclease/phosphatase family metal-dependent hydrolase
VAVAAYLGARTRDGRGWRIQVASVHLESSPSGWRSDEEQRLEQAEALIDMLPPSEAAIAAGDFNTKTRGRMEALVFPMRRAYPQTPPFPAGPTYRKAFGLYREYLDYIFFRLPEASEAWYGRVPREYASDHFPLVGRVTW